MAELPPGRGGAIRSVWQKVARLTLLLPAALYLLACATQTVDPRISGTGFIDHGVEITSNGPSYHLRNGDVLEIIYQIRAKEIPAYHLNIQDVVELRYVSLPHMNGSQVIRADGLLTVPLIGDLHVLGMTPAKATALIREKYKNVLRDPDVYLIVKEYGAATRELKKVITTRSRGQSKLLTIRPDGKITLPIVGELHSSGRTLKEVSEQINKRYQEYYPELQVDVILFKAADQFVYVLGAVQKAGAFEVRRPMTVGQMLALAGGTNERSRITDVIIARQIGNELLIRKVDYKAALEGRNNVFQAVLRPDDILYVPRRALANNAQISKEIGQLMLFNGFTARVKN